MRIDPIKIEQQNKLIYDYKNKKSDLQSFFDYEETERSLKDRVNELMNRSFQRKRLAEVLKTMNKTWDAPESTMHNIDRLKDPESVVVIGGQQAGLLTGPMYTIHKIISIVTYAKQQEKLLTRPVIPVFWIAGEDHDFAEINHVYMPEKTEMKKLHIQQTILEKYPVSDIELNKEHATRWLDTVFTHLNETKHTKSLYEEMNRCLDKSNTYVDFFANVLFYLFQNEGIVLADSGNQDIRQLEANYFVQMIENQQEINHHVYQAHKKLLYLGYTIDLDVAENAGHLFYHKNHERILLFRDEQGNWVGKQKEVMFTTEELVHIAKNKPHLLSNNVVTRPLMQDLLFPTLAFIGGPGEISYWSVLKNAFHILQMNMPPLIPRLSFTMVNQQIVDKAEKYGITVTDVVNHGVDFYKQKWLQSQFHPPIEHMFHQLKKTVDASHKPIRSIAQQMRDDLGGLAEKNLERINREIEFLQKRISLSMEEKYTTDLAAFDELNQYLHPLGGLQERVWNPLPWMNQYGISFIRQLIEQDITFTNDHFLVQL